MREIEGIERVMDMLQPYWEQIHEDFDRENRHFKALIAQDHDDIGRVLKCHLVVENYLSRFLTEHYNIESLDSARLNFFQKASLLPDSGSAAAFVKPGILRLNSIRNRFGHTLQPALQEHDLGAIPEVLAVARNGVQFDSVVAAIEAFTTVACTWLLVPNQQIQAVFMDAFSEVRANAHN
jgi:hypothetical protein